VLSLRVSTTDAARVMSANGSAVDVFHAAAAALVCVTADPTADRTRLSKPNAIRFASLMSLRAARSMRLRATSSSEISVARPHFDAAAIADVADASVVSGYSISASTCSARFADMFDSEIS
jgi:hypothetical protein